jgi:hypothetical protein
VSGGAAAHPVPSDHARELVRGGQGARVVSEAVPEVDTIGTITLDRAVGGMNPVAVEVAAREGARIVWFRPGGSRSRTRGRRPSAAR